MYLLKNIKVQEKRINVIKLYLFYSPKNNNINKLKIIFKNNMATKTHKYMYLLKDIKVHEKLINVHVSPKKNIKVHEKLINVHVSPKKTSKCMKNS